MSNNHNQQIIKGLNHRIATKRQAVKDIQKLIEDTRKLTAEFEAYSK